MERINPLSLKRIQSVTETRTFTDPLQPGIEIPVTLLVSVDTGSMTDRMDSIRKLVEQFVTGDSAFVESNGERGEPSAPLFLPDSTEKSVITEQLCVQIGNLMYYESAAVRAAKKANKETSDPYDFMEWLTVSERMPSAFLSMVAFYNDLGAKAYGLLKNNNRVSGDDLSRLPDPNPPIPTPNS